MTTPWDIYEEHLEEASFLWGQRDNALMSAHHSLEDAADLEERLHAHLDGLVLGGTPVAERLLLPALTHEEEATRLSAVASALIAEHDDTVDRVLSVLEEGEELQRSGVRRALEVTEREDLAARLSPLLDSRKSKVRAAVLDVFAFRRLEPGAALPRLLRDGDLRVQRAALRAARAVAGSIDREFLQRALGSDAPELRDEALETGAVLGQKAAWDACLKDAQRSSASTLALALLGMGADGRELDLCRARLEDAKARGTALWALGLSGRVAAANACLSYLGDGNKLVARLAAEAFCAITGLVLENDYLVEPEPESEEPIPLEEEDLDASLVPTPEEALPLANPERVEEWWRDAQKGFSRDGRYLYGKPFEAAWFLHVLARASMRRRHVLALELAVRTRGQLWLEPRDTVARQLRRMEAFGELQGVRFTLPFKSLLTVA